MRLASLQKAVARAVMQPLTRNERMQPVAPGGERMHAYAARYIKPNDRLSSFDRLEIYNRQYWFRVITAVAEDFPALNAVLGSEAFDELVLAYLRENPSSSFTLRNLGSRLPEWLQNHAEFTSGNHDLAMDIARLEWAYVQAFDRATIPPVNGADLAGFDGETKLSLQPHLQLLDLQYPVDELVLAVHRETGPSDIMSNAISERRQTSEAVLPEMTRQDVYLAVHRYDNSVYYRRIDREAYQLLSSLQSGSSLGFALETAFEGGVYSLEDQTAKIQECFAHAAELGWFCITTPN